MVLRCFLIGPVTAEAFRDGLSSPPVHTHSSCWFHANNPGEDQWFVSMYPDDVVSWRRPTGQSQPGWILTAADWTRRDRSHYKEETNHQNVFVDLAPHRASSTTDPVHRPGGTPRRRTSQPRLRAPPMPWVPRNLEKLDAPVCKLQTFGSLTSFLSSRSHRHQHFSPPAALPLCRRSEGRRHDELLRINGRCESRPKSKDERKDTSPLHPRLVAVNDATPSESLFIPSPYAKSALPCPKPSHFAQMASSRTTPMPSLARSWAPPSFCSS